MCSKCGRMRSYSLAGREARIRFPIWLWGNDTSIGGSVPLSSTDSDKHRGRAQLRNDYSRQYSVERRPFVMENRWLVEKTPAILFYIRPQIQDSAVRLRPGISQFNPH